MKEISYIKTQWFRLLIAIVCLVVCCIYAFKPAPDTTTIEGLELQARYNLNASMYFISCIIWLFSSVMEYLIDCVNLLEKKTEKYDALSENVTALNEANRIDREHMRLLEQRFNQFKYDLEDR